MLKLLHQICHSFYDLKFKLSSHSSKLQYVVRANSALETQLENFIDCAISNYKQNFSAKLGSKYLEQLILLKQMVTAAKQLLDDHQTELPQYLELRNKILNLFIAGVLYDLNKLLREQNNELMQNFSVSITDHQIHLNKIFSRFLSDAGCFSLFSLLLIKKNDDWPTAIINLLIEHPEPEIQKIAVVFYQNTALCNIHIKYINLKSSAIINHKILQDKTSVLPARYNLIAAFSE